MFLRASLPFIQACQSVYWCFPLGLLAAAWEREWKAAPSSDFSTGWRLGRKLTPQVLTGPGQLQACILRASCLKLKLPKPRAEGLMSVQPRHCMMHFIFLRFVLPGARCRGRGMKAARETMRRPGASSSQQPAFLLRGSGRDS